MTVATAVVPVVHRKDPKSLIHDDLKGLVDKLEPTGGDVVVCVYERPKEIQLAGGKTLLTPDNYSRTNEDKFQGVVGLVVKLGPNFHEKRQALGLDPPIKLGDWVSFRTQDCVAFTLGTRAMRQLEGQFLRQRLADPDCII